MLVSFLAGFGLSSSLIIAIGAQNAFVLRQGLLREHVFAVVLICSLSDAILIAVGVGGLATLMTTAPWIEFVFTYGGAAFLFWYGTKSFKAALHGGEALEPSKNRAVPLKEAIVTCLALTWLNPHVYLDTVILIGSVSAHYNAKIAFAIGAAVASALFFFLLGYGARLLVGFFANPRTWQVLEAVIGAVMWTIAVKLIMG